MKTLRKIVSKITILGIVMTLMSPSVANAVAALTYAQDQLSTNEAAVVANHTIYFVTPTGVAAGQKIVLEMTGFSIPALLDYEDMDLAEGDSGTCTGPGAATYTDEVLGASASGATWSAVRTSGTVITMVSGTGTITAGMCVKIEIGDNANSVVTGVEQITNAAVGSRDIMISTTTAGDATIDTATVSVAMITTPRVNLGADVGSTLSMTLGADVELGYLSTTSATPASTTVTINTNATNGYVLQYNASALTGPSANIFDAQVAQATLTNNIEAWGINIADTAPTSVGGSSPTAEFLTNYNVASQYMVATGANTNLGYANGTADTHIYTVSYAAKMNALTPAGHYTGTTDFVVFASF